MDVARSREQEEKRINKELANIRSKFKEGNMNGYQKKKYVCKLLYIYLLGYDIEFGHVEAVNLITSSKYTEKQIGYVAVTLLLTETNDLVRLVINSIKKDLADIHEVNTCLALQAVANLGGREIAESLVADVFKILAAGNAINFIKKKAAVCLLRLYRKHPDVIPVDEWSEKIIGLLDDFDHGINLAGLSLITTLAMDHPEIFAAAVPKAIHKLAKIILDKEYTPDNVYYGVPVPWLQVKLLRLLRLYPVPADRPLKEKLITCLRSIFTSSAEIPKNVQQNNAVNSILVEAIYLATHIDPESDMVEQACASLARYISSKETNMRYIGLEMMAPLSAYPNALTVIKTHQDIVLASLKDKDISVRRRGLDLIYCLCDTSNSKTIVDELVRYLSVADYDLREEMILKIAILTEKFATDPSWYLDVILQLITIAGDQVSNEVWHRVIQIITNTQVLHEYAPKQLMVLLKNPACHESAVKVGAYVLGEYGDIIVNNPGCSPREQFTLLHSKFPLCSSATRAILLSAYVKFINIFPEIKKEVLEVFEGHQHALDTELQQRACEYTALAAKDDLLQTVFEQMPPFPERESALVQRLRKQMIESGDKRGMKIVQDSSRARKPGVASSNVTTSLSNSSAASAPANVDLLGLDVGVSSVSTAAVPSIPQSKIDDWLENLLRVPGGILYEDSTIQIGVKTEYSGFQGKLALFIGNKTTNPINNFTASITQAENVNVTITNNISVIGAAAQVQLFLTVEVIAIPSNLPRFNCQYSSNSTPLSLALPIALSKFLEPILMNANDFLARWKQIGAGAKEAQEVLKSATSIQPQAFRTLFTSLNLGVLENVDPNPNNIVFASILHSQRHGKVGCLGRLEVSAEQNIYRLTVRVTNEAATTAVKAFVCQRISKV